MADKPKSTADILSSIRKAAPAAPAGESPAADAPAAAAPALATVAATKPPSEAPKGTAGILASIRAAKAGGEAAPAAAAPAAPAAASAGAAPKGTSSILASIRGGGAAAPTAAQPAVKAAVAKAAPPAERPDVQGMIRAIKEGVKVPEPGAPKRPPKLPGGKPDVVVVKGGAAKGGKSAPQPRRSVFAPIVALVSTPFALAWSLMTILGGIFTLKGAQFMMPNMVLELPSKFKVGVSSDFPLGTVSEKYKAARGVWIVHTDAYDGKNTIYALASVCTHLGCTPNWLEGEQKFKCPCHGSGFYISGVNFEGPAPRPLERVGIRVSEDGQIEVDKSVKFQEELGQWADGKSFIELV